MHVYPSAAVLCLSLLACSLHAQAVPPEDHSGATGLRDDNIIPTTPLQYGDPMLVANLSKTGGISGNLHCGSDGSILFMLYVADNWKDATGHPRGHISLVSVTPEGKLTSIPWQTVPGYTDIDVPSSYFANGGRYYLLTSGRKATPDESGVKPAEVPLALTFDETGNLKNVAPLDPALDPISLAAFGSGDLLLISEDTLNRRMRLTVTDPSGGSPRNLSLEDSDDPTHHDGPTASGSKGGVTFAPHTLLGMIEAFPYGQDLLLVPQTTSGLPVLEVNEAHVVASVVPQLPKGDVIARFIPSDGRTWNIRLGSLNDSVYRMLDANGQAHAAGVMESKTIAEIDPSTGEIVRKLEMGVNGVYPACRVQSDFVFLTAHRKDGSLEVVKASAK